MNDKPQKKKAYTKYDTAELCAALLDRSPDAIFILNPRQQFMDANLAGVVMLGYTREALLKLSLPDLLGPEEINKMKALKLEAGEGRPVKCHLRHKSGKYLPMMMEARRLAHGNFLLTVSSVPKRRPKQIRPSLKNLKEIVDRSPAIAFHWRAAEGWPVEFVSDNIQQFGYTPLDFYSGRVPFASIVHPDDLERVAAEVNEYSQKGYVEFPQEYRIVTAAGDIRWVDDRTWVQRDAKGGIEYYQGIILDITDRKKAEEALRRSESQLRLITDNMVDVISQVDAKLNIIYSSPSLERVFGYQPQTIIGKTVAGWMHPEDMEPAIKRAAEARKAGLPSVGLEYRWRRADGEYLWVESATRLLYDEKGESAGAIFVSRDITDRKQAEAALRESEEKFRSIVENSLAGIFMVDDAYHFVYANDELCHILGYPRSELIGMDFRTSLAKESLDLVADRYVRRQRGETHPPRYELKAVRPNGEMRDIEMIVSVVKDQTGKPYSMGQLVDITERKRLEHETEKRRLFLENVLATAPDAIVVSDARHIISEWNPGAERLFGYSPEEAFGRKIDDLITGTDQQVLDEAARWTSQIQSRRGITSTETVRCRKDGSPVNVIVSIAPILTGDEWAGVVAVYTDITKRKQAEKALQQLSRQDEEALRVAKMGHWEFDIPGGFFTFNDQYYTLHGTTAKEMGGYQMTAEDFARKLVHPEEASSVGESIQQGIAATDPNYQLRFEARILRVDGEVRWVTVWFRIAKDTEGNTVKLYGVNQDITERKQAEEALRESEEKYRVFIENLPIGVYRTTPGPKGKVLIANSAYLKTFGFSSMEELFQINVADLYANPLERKNFSDALLAKGHVHRVELHMKRRDGSLMWATVTASVAHGDKGEVYFDCAMEDITERKQVEEALRESEEKYRRLVEVSPIPTWINKDGIITYMNPAALQVLGATHLDQVLGRAALDFIHPDYHAVVKERIAQMVDEEKTVPLMEEKYLRLDGSIIDVDVTAAPFTTFGGSAIQVLFQDITQRKLNEAEREALVANLEAKNAELERFTYTVSHDLKAPLITIRGFLGYLEQDIRSGDMPRLKQDMQRIIAATDKLQRLLRELLELSRIGRLMNPPENVPLGDLVQEAIKLMEGRLRERQVEIRIQEDLPIVRGDAQRLLEVMQNLLDNAVKFMGDQFQPIIEIGTRGEENDMPIVYVRDNGIGIAPEHHERIFGLFNKLDSGAEGTGVGLAIVKRIIEVHRGRIWVESEPGKGSTFYFTFEKETGDPGMDAAVSGKV